MKKQFGELSQFLKRDVELFRSSDLNNTAVYFTDVEHEDRETAKAFFEVLKFELKGGDHQLYIRFPNTDHFVEIVGGGFGSGRGNMTVAHGENPWKDKKYDVPLTVYTFDKNLMIVFGKNSHDFEFLTRVASYDKGNPFNYPYPNETFVNYQEIEEALKLKYLKVPEDIRCIEYCYKTQEETPTYFIVDYPKYNFHYDNHRFFVVKENDIKEFQVKNFQRYKDGGTTIIKVVDNLGVEHDFFSPTSLPTKTLCETWDKIKVVDVTDEEKQMLIEKLKLTVIPDTRNKLDSIRYIINKTDTNIYLYDELYSTIKDIVLSDEEDFEESYLNKLLNKNKI